MKSLLKSLDTFEHTFHLNSHKSQKSLLGGLTTLILKSVLTYCFYVNVITLESSGFDLNVFDGFRYSDDEVGDGLDHG